LVLGGTPTMHRSHLHYSPRNQTAAAAAWMQYRHCA
jgi:hypothetical protein